MDINNRYDNFMQYYNNKVTRMISRISRHIWGITIVLFLFLFIPQSGSAQSPENNTNPDISNTDGVNLNLPQLNNGLQTVSPQAGVTEDPSLWQNGTDHQAFIQQVEGNKAVVYQGGEGNALFLNQTGDKNTSVVVQHGSGNTTEQTVEGNNNKSLILQFGDNNTINQQFYTDDMKYFITQWGNDNQVISYENGAGAGNGHPLGVIQVGQGIKIEIINGSHVPFGTATPTQDN